MKIVLLSLFIIGCGTTEPIPQQVPNLTISKLNKIYDSHQLDPLAKQGVEEFNINVQTKKFVAIVFDNSLLTGDKIVGTCFTFGKKRVISLRESYKKYSADDIELKLLIWHELGHCIIGREHNNKSISISGELCNEKDDDWDFICKQEFIAVSFMRWRVFDYREIRIYNDNVEKYWIELKTRAIIPPIEKDYWFQFDSDYDFDSQVSL